MGVDTARDRSKGTYILLRGMTPEASLQEVTEFT